MRRYAWLIYLVAACTSVIGYYALPTAAVQDLAFVVVGLVGTVGVAVGIWWHRPVARLPWLLFLAGLVSFTLAQMVYAVQQVVLGLVAPFPSGTDALVLVYFCMVAAGLVAVIRRRLPGRDTESLLDAALLATAGGASAWLVLAPWFTAAEVPPLAQTSALGYPAASLLLFGLAVRLLLSGGVRIPAIRLVVIALTVQLLGSLLYASSTLRGVYRTGSVIDALLLLAPLLWASAALHPSMGLLTARAHAQLQRYAVWRLAVLTVAVVALPIAVGTLALLDWPLQLAPVVVSSGLVPLLVVARLALAMRDAHSFQAQLARAQSTQALGRLAGGIAHDFNNLLSAALGHTEIARASIADPEAQRHLDQAVQTQRRAADLVSQLLTFSRGDVPRPGVTDLNEVVESMRLLLERVIGEHIVLSTRTCEWQAVAPLDRTAVEQIVVNLALNARDAMPQGGTLTICTERGHFELTDRRAPSEAVLLIVEDTGIGMDQATATRMFEPFFTTKGDDGTGLGLSSVQGLVAGVGGDIRVESNPGKGTTIEVILPAATPRSPVEAPAVPEAAPEPRRATALTVLVVDDQASIRAVVTEILRREGHAVLQAADGVEALDVLEQEDQIDLLVTDVLMPRLGGLELAERVRERNPSSRVLYISGYSEQGAVLRQSSGSAFLQKPFTINQLLEAVGQLDQAPQRRDVR